jgi:hypothetical protein
MIQQRRFSIIEYVRRIWSRRRAERRLLTTFWPKDYRRAKTYQIHGHTYRITRYVQALDDRFYEVWGYPVPAHLTRQSSQRCSRPLNTG